MADTKQTIDIIFNGVDRTATAISSVIGNVEGGAGRIQALAEPIAGLTVGILKFEAAILASGAALTLFAVKTAGDFDAAFREIATLIDAPLDQLDGFRASLLDYASGSTQSLDKISASVYAAISAGVDYTESLSVVQRAEQLAVASKADLGDTLVLLVSSLNAYGKGADDAERFSDALFTTVKAGQTTLPELANSLAQVTGLAASAGVPFETLLAAVAALTAAGLPTSQSITSIKAALSNIIKPSSDAAKLAEELGVEFNATALQTKGFEGVLQDVARATGGNVDQMARFFGSVEGLNAVLTLTGKGGDKFTDTLEAMRNASGATDEAFQKMADSIGLGGQQIQNALKTLLIAIGTPLLDEFGGIQQAVSAIFQSIGSSLSDGEMGRLVGFIEELAGDIERTLQAVAENIPDALAGADSSGFIGGLDVVKQAILGIFDGADITTAEGLKRAIEILGSGFMTLSTFSANAVKAIGPFVELLAELAAFVAELDPEIVKLAGSLGGIAVVAAPVLSALTSVAGGVRVLIGYLVGAGSLNVALSAVAASPVAIAAALTALGYAAYQAGTYIYGLTEHSKEYQAIQAEIAEAEKLRVSLSGQVAGKLADISRETGLVITSMDDLNRLEREGAILFDESTGKWIAAKQKMSEAIQFALDAEGNLLGAVSKSTDALDDNKDAAISTAAAYYEMMGTTPELARRMAELELPVKKTAEAMADAEKKSEAYQLKMLELASNERIKNIEFAVNLKVSQLENETKRIEAAFRSVDQVLSDTGKNVVDLAGLFAGISSTDINSLTKMREIRNQLDKENERRDKALALQEMLIKAQIEYMELRNQAMRNGDAAIKINMDGVEPELEMIMWKIIERVQIRVNEEAAEFLLGVPGA